MNEELGEGVPAHRIHMVGKGMIDSLVRSLTKAKRSSFPATVLDNPASEFCLVTMHRPSNVDELDVLSGIIDALVRISEVMPVVFPVHPRTRAKIGQLDWVERDHSGLKLLEPIGYIEMLSLTRRASLVVTDSGGLQEETTYLGVPCLTIRANTERPITVTEGTNRLVEPSFANILEEFSEFRKRGKPERPVIDGWEGNAGERIVQVVCEGASFPVKFR